MEYQFEGLGPTLSVVTLLFLFAAVIVVVAVAVGIAALPGQIAKRRNHPQAAAVNICGWFGLPTGILWVVALVWAYYRFEPMGTVSAADQESLAKQLRELEKSVASLESGLAGASR
ncbi:DUF3302 domain-containing protein [Neorhodopirellula lusitana]|uniref:DUF3302 domain-containing protein n=1 Tax=Neorhodopirellula lusitana TaxID=445327 RepID=UPI00384DC03F